MKLDKSMGTLFVLSMLAVIPVACEEDYMSVTNPATAQKANAYANYEIDWAEAADSVSTAFVERFYCSSNRNGADGVFSYSEYNRQNNNGNCYWQQAHAMAAMVDYYNRIRLTDPDQAALLRSYFRRWYDKRGNNYEGNASWRGSSGFGNDFTDDTLWITIALLQIYDATEDPVYYEAAKQTWDECVRPRFARNEYGWLPWKMTDSGANSCTNGPGAIASAMLARHARDNGNVEEYERYLLESQTCFDQNIHAMNTDGTLDNPPLSYTQGTCMEAGRLLWHLTGQTGFLQKAIAAARGQMTSSAMNSPYQEEMIMRDEGADENNAIFHAVFFHWAARMAADREIDAVDPTIRQELSRYMLRHASYYWTLGIDKSPLGWGDSYFSVVCTAPREAGTGGSLGAYASAAQAIESMWIIEQNR